MGFLPTIIIEMYAEFQLKVKENKGVLFFFFWPFKLKDPMNSIHELLRHPRIAGYCSTQQHVPLTFSLLLGSSLLWPFHSRLPGLQPFLKYIRYSFALGFVPSTWIPSLPPSSLYSNLTGS